MSGTRLTPKSCGTLLYLYDKLIVGHVVCVPVMGLVCYLVIAYLLGCPWQIVPCGCVTLGDWTIVSALILWLDGGTVPSLWL